MMEFRESPRIYSSDSCFVFNGMKKEKQPYTGGWEFVLLHHPQQQKNTAPTKNPWNFTICDPVLDVNHKKTISKRIEFNEPDEKEEVNLIENPFCCVELEKSEKIHTIIYMSSQLLFDFYL